MKNIRSLFYKTLLIPILCQHLVSCDGGDDSGAQAIASTQELVEIQKLVETQELVEAREVSKNFEGAFIEPELKPHFYTFLEEADKRGIAINPERVANLSIRFADLPSGTTGLCTTSELDGRAEIVEIQISSSLRGGNLEWVVIHELGHCLLHMQHRETLLSVMNSAIFTSELNQKDREQIFDEFFDPQYFEKFF